MDAPTSLPTLLRRVASRMGLVWLWLPVAFVVPWLDSTQSPYVDLTGWMGAVAYGLAVSGSARQGAWLVLALLLVLVSRPGVSIPRRAFEFGVAGTVILFLLGGGSAMNEYVIKPGFAYPRPHVVALARTPTGATPDSSLLRMTPEAFYRQAPEARRTYLRAITRLDTLEVLGYRFCFEEQSAYRDLHLRTDICDHWISVTSGFSFPSGHAFAALFIATLFWGLALRFLGGWRLGLIQYLVVPWAVLVAYSRVVLRVHTPLDITVGGLLGIAVGLAALLVVVALLKPRSS